MRKPTKPSWSCDAVETPRGWYVGCGYQFAGVDGYWSRDWRTAGEPFLSREDAAHAADDHSLNRQEGSGN